MALKEGPENRLAWVSKVGPKGQIVLSKKARDMFGINPGDSLLILADKKRGICIPDKNKTNKLLNSVFAEIADTSIEDEEDDEGEK